MNGRVTDPLCVMSARSASSVVTGVNVLCNGRAVPKLTKPRRLTQIESYSVSPIFTTNPSRMRWLELSVNTTPQDAGAIEPFVGLSSGSSTGSSLTVAQIVELLLVTQSSP